MFGPLNPGERSHLWCPKDFINMQKVTRQERTREEMKHTAKQEWAERDPEKGCRIPKRWKFSPQDRNKTHPDVSQGQAKELQIYLHLIFSSCKF